MCALVKQTQQFSFAVILICTSHIHIFQPVAQVSDTISPRLCILKIKKRKENNTDPCSETESRERDSKFFSKLPILVYLLFKTVRNYNPTRGTLI